MPLFGRRKQTSEVPPARGFADDALSIRAALGALQAELARAAGRERPRPVDLRAVVRELLDGQVAPPTADVAALTTRVDADDFYEQELAPSWEGLGEAQRAARLDGFIDLCAMVAQAGAGSGIPAQMAETVRTKTLLLAWAFDETYGYLGRLARDG